MASDHELDHSAAVPEEPVDKRWEVLADAFSPYIADVRRDVVPAPPISGPPDGPNATRRKPRAHTGGRSHAQGDGRTYLHEFVDPTEDDPGESDPNVLLASKMAIQRELAARRIARLIARGMSPELAQAQVANRPHPVLDEHRYRVAADTPQPSPVHPSLAHPHVISGLRPDGTVG